MGAIPLSSVKGDVAVGRNVDIGGDVDIKGHIHAGHNLTVDGWFDAPNVKGPSKGLFPSETAMKAAYPLPEPGWWALVGDTLPADVWCVEDGKWTATGKKSGNLTVANLTLDARIDEVKRAVDLTTAALDALVSGDTSDAIDNYNEIIKFLEGFRDDETLAGTLKTLRDTAEEAHTRLSAGLSAALPRIVSIADIDTMGTDGSAEALRKFMRELSRTGPAHTRYALVNRNYIAGVLEIFSDNSLNGITQVLETHQSVEDGVLQPNAHDAGSIHRWWRTMNFAGNSQSGLKAGEWTPWRECEPEGLREDLTTLRGELQQRLDAADKAVDTVSKGLASKPWRGDLKLLPFDGTVDSEFTLAQNGAEWEGKTVYVDLAHGFATVAPYWNVSSGTPQVAGYRVGYLPEYTEGTTVLDRRPRADRVYVCDGQVYVPSGNTIAPVCTAASLSSAVSQLRASIEKNRQTISSVQTEMYGLLDECPWRGDLGVYPLAGTVFNAQASTDSMEAWRLYYDADDHRVAMLDDETSEVTYPQGPNNVMHGIAAGNQEALFILNGELCHITNGGLVFLVDGDEIEAMKEDATALAGRVTDLETGHVPSNQYYALCESLFGRDFTLVANEKVRGLWAYDRNTRRYSFDRLTNITRPQMDAALLAAPLMFRAAHQAGDFALPGLRFCVIPYGTTLAAGMFADSEVEEAVFPGTFNNYPSISGTPNLFDGAAKLRYVVGYLNVRWAAEGSMQTFRGCSALEEIRIFKLTQNISFSDSPNLSMETLQYLVDNASNTSSIFVGLHADCYARLTEEVRAAANEKGISFGIV